MTVAVPPRPMADPGLRAAPRGQFDRNLKLLLSLIGRADPRVRSRLSEGDMRKRTTSFLDETFDPIQKQLEGAYGRAGERGHAAIHGYTDAYMGRLGQVATDTDEAYKRSQGETQRAEETLLGGARAQANTAADSLAATAKAAGLEGAPDIERVRQAGMGVAGDVGGRGFTGLASLATEGAAQRSEAAALPGIGALAGMRYGRDLQAGLDEGLRGELGSLSSRRAGMGAEMMEGLRDQELEKASRLMGHRTTRAQLGQGLLGDFDDANLQRALARAGFSSDMYGADLGLAGDVYNADQDAATAAGKAATTQANKVQQARSRAYTAAAKIAAGMGKAPIGPGGIPTQGWKRPSWQEAYNRVGASLRAQLPNAPDNVIGSLTVRALQAAGFTKKANPRPVTNRGPGDDRPG